MSGPNSGQIWINGKVYDFLDVLQNDQMFPPSRSPTGSARVYFDQSTQKLMLSENGGAYAPIAAGSQTPWTSNINGGGYTLTNVKWSRCIQMTANLSNAKSDSNYIKLIDEPSCPLFPNGIKVTGVQVTCFNKTSGMTDVSLAVKYCNGIGVGFPGASPTVIDSFTTNTGLYSHTGMSSVVPSNRVVYLEMTSTPASGEVWCLVLNYEAVV